MRIASTTAPAANCAGSTPNRARALAPASAPRPAEPCQGRISTVGRDSPPDREWIADEADAGAIRAGKQDARPPLYEKSCESRAWIGDGPRNPLAASAAIAGRANNS